MTEKRRRSRGRGRKRKKEKRRGNKAKNLTEREKVEYNENIQEKTRNI